MNAVPSGQQDAGGHTINRILALSPKSYETSRRNFSRIFIVPPNESVIDLLLFGASRSMDDFIPVASRAIAEAGFAPNSGVDLQLRSVIDPTLGAGALQSHIVANAWLVDDNSDAYDLFVEVNGVEAGDLPEMESYDANISPESDILENPLCIKLDIEAITPSFGQMTTPIDLEDDDQQDTVSGPQAEPEVQARETGIRGRVANPETDRRLKENRERPKQMEVARASQDRSDNDTGGTSNMARQAGKPGRVRMPALDGRLRNNRRAAPAEAGAGGR